MMTDLLRELSEAVLVQKGATQPQAARVMAICRDYLARQPDVAEPALSPPHLAVHPSLQPNQLVWLQWLAAGQELSVRVRPDGRIDWSWWQRGLVSCNVPGSAAKGTQDDFHLTYAYLPEIRSAWPARKYAPVIHTAQEQK